MPLSDVLVLEWAPGDLPNELAPTWAPFTEHVVQGFTDRGRSGIFDLYDAGKMELHVNNGHPGQAPWLSPLSFYRHLQIRARYVGGIADSPIFTGYIDDVDFHADDAPFKGTVKISSHDAGGLFSNLEFPDDADAEFAPHDDFPNTGTIENVIYYAILRSGLPVTFNADRWCTQAFLGIDEKPTGNIWQWVQDNLEAEHGTVQVSAYGELCLNGRWTPFLGFGDDPIASDLAFVDNAVDPIAGRYAYRRDGVVFAKPGSQYRNDITAKSKWLGTTPVNISNVPTGYPAESLSRTELPFIHQPWVDANAKLWAQIYSQASTFPQKMSFLVWAGETLLPVGSADGGNEIGLRLTQATGRLGVVNVTVEYTHPGQVDADEYLVTPEAVRFDFDQESLKATLGFSSRDAWRDAYDLTVGLVTIDGDSDHGIDSDAILAP